MRLFLIALLAGCAHTVPRVSGDLPGDRVVLRGELRGGGGLVVRGADGRRYAVKAGTGRFVVALPAGVYEIGGRTISGIPGDVLDLGTIRSARDEVVFAEPWGFVAPAGASAAPLAPGSSFYAGEAHARSMEAPGAYRLRTKDPYPRLPGPGRFGQGIGLRSR